MEATKKKLETVGCIEKDCYLKEVMSFLPKIAKIESTGASAAVHLIL
jgi:hypothetical protein